MKLKSAIWDFSKKSKIRYLRVVTYFRLYLSGGVESTDDLTPLGSIIEQKIVIIYRSIHTNIIVTFYFHFSEEIVSLLEFIFARILFLGVRPSIKIKK